MPVSLVHLLSLKALMELRDSLKFQLEEFGGENVANALKEVEEELRRRKGCGNSKN